MSSDKTNLPDSILVIADGDMVVIMTGADENGTESRVTIFPEDVDVICKWMKQKAREIQKVNQ